MEDQQDMRENNPPKRRRRWGLIVLAVCSIFIGAIVGGIVIIGERYHGPRNLDEVTVAMPGVPIFPFADVAPANRTAQRMLALPLLLARMHGAVRADAVMLQAPSDRDFVQAWYKQAMSFQGWAQAKEEVTSERIRLVFTRRREAVQIFIGQTQDQIITPIELIYVSGLTSGQIQQLRQ